MTLKSLAIRTKKSLSGLYAIGKIEDQASPLPETPKKYPTTSTALVHTPDGGSPRLEEGFSPVSMSSSTDSPSKRVLRRSLRKMRSSLDVLRGKPADEALSHVVRTPPSKPRPSLALNFEASPPDQPMFNTERYSCNSSRADIHHSSPITVPSSKKSTPMYRPPFPMGTVPDTPGPIKKAVDVEECSSPRPMRLNDMPMSSPLAHGPLPTPMPGTNLSFEDIQMEPPAIIISSPSVPFMESDGYFAIPTSRSRTVVEYKYNTVPHGAEEQQGVQRMPAASPAESKTLVNDAPCSESLVVPKAEPDADPYALDEEARKSLERKADYVTAYLGFHDALPRNEGSTDLVRRRSTWSRHTGLYDGTGYASECVEEDVTGQTASPKANTPELSTDEKAPRLSLVEQCLTSGTGMMGEPGPAVDSQEASVPRSASPRSEAVPATDDQDKEALQDIIRAYTVYHRHGKEESEQDVGTSSESRYQNGCNRSEINVSARSTSTTLVG